MGMNYLTLLLALPLTGSALLFLGVRRINNYLSGVIALLLSLSTMIISCLLLLDGARIKSVALTLPWIESLRISFSLYFDGLTAILLLTMTFITTLALLYSLGYFKGRDSFNGASFYSLVLLFLAGVLGVVLSADLILFYLFWEAMLLPAWAMVTYFGLDKERSGAIGLKYFIFTHVGAVLILAAILIMYSVTGTTSMLSLKSVLPGLDIGLLRGISLLLIIGFAFKMAIFPLHSWLPETYANAPMPATILLSAVMINAPIYGYLRFFFSVLPRNSITPFILFMMVFALISQFYGAIMAMSERCIKKMIAYSSISQMGYVLFGIASLTQLGVAGATFHIINHGIIKALLFMSVGAVIYSTGKHYSEDLGGLAGPLPYTALLGTVGALAIAGVPLFSAFQSEWMIFAGGFQSQYPILAAISVFGVVFTAAYALLFVAKTFFGKLRSGSPKESPLSLRVSMVVLALSTLAIGIWPTYVSKLVQMAVRMLGV